MNNMVKCKVKPSFNQCYACTDMAVSCCAVQNCETCSRDAVVLGFTPPSMFKSTMAVVSINGKLQEVPFDRIFDVGTGGEL